VPNAKTSLAFCDGFAGSFREGSLPCIGKCLLALLRLEKRGEEIQLGWVGLEPTTNALKGRCSTIELPTRQETRE
jgi:hypothetical protein